MMGLVLMAAELAELRAGYGPRDSNFDNVGLFLATRRELRKFKPDEVTFSREYYQIIDRIERGEKP